LAGGLTSIIADSVAKIPREIAKQHVIEKLETHSIDDENLAEALTEHLFSETSEPFEYDDPKYDDLSITFSDEDTKAMMAEIQDFSDNKLPEVVQKTLDAVSRDFLDELKADWPEQKTYQEEQHFGFQKRLELRWQKTLDPLEMMLICSHEIGQSGRTRDIGSVEKWPRGWRIRPMADYL